ncbi:hypothetical protein SKAU_G00310090 [Synaphobranchus kaupii]|uniref:Uncharacterized protein n=1 Tax=Synaphobranchus kaupii TaxID=118154 RepID=A0A9Q1ERH0_SYNKA|nr:hypothetical protein SKAU_G00310090 [Synaphobranchus kaupii]
MEAEVCFRFGGSRPQLDQRACFTTVSSGQTVPFSCVVPSLVARGCTPLWTPEELIRNDPDLMKTLQGRSSPPPLRRQRQKQRNPRT